MNTTTNGNGKHTPVGTLHLSGGHTVESLLQTILNGSTNPKLLAQQALDLLPKTKATNFLLAEEIDEPISSGHNIQFTHVDVPPERKHVRFTVVHSDTQESEEILIPLTNPTNAVMQALKQLANSRFDKPTRKLIPDFTKLNSMFARVTPYEALMFLKNNKKQRGLKVSAVERYCQAHREQRWLVTNQGVGFDVDGCDVDGQHRLFAIVLSGTPMPLLLVWGLSPDVRKVVDNGVGRTPGQVDDMENGLLDELPSGPTTQNFTTKIYLAHGGSTNTARLYYESTKALYLQDLEWLNPYICKNSKWPLAKKNALKTAGVSSAFLMLHHAFPEETAEFAELVFSQNRDNPAASKTSDYLFLQRAESDDDYLDTMYKIFTGFWAFKDNTPIERLRAIYTPKGKGGGQHRRSTFLAELHKLWFAGKGKSTTKRCDLLPEDALKTVPGTDFLGT